MSSMESNTRNTIFLGREMNQRPLVSKLRILRAIKVILIILFFTKVYFNGNSVRMSIRNVPNKSSANKLFRLLKQKTPTVLNLLTA